MYIQYGTEVNECNRSFDETKHEAHCFGKCKRIPLTDTEVDLHNEIEEWKKNEMLFQGVPDVLPEFPQGGVKVDILQTEMILRAVIELTNIDEDLLNQRVQELNIERMQLIRKAVEENRAKEGLLVPQKTIILPSSDIKH